MNLLVILAVIAALCVNVAFSRRWSQRYKDSRGEMCRSGDGSSYRGLVSTSTSGLRCLTWSWFEEYVGGVEKGLGQHNHCRNPDKSLMPWCYVFKGRRVTREYCKIPKCSPLVPRAPPTAKDTEASCGERSERRMNKVVGGSFVPIESQPWVAAIYTPRKFLCGGSLISPCWVLSAAHCFPEIKEPGDLTVFLGKSAINDTDGDREQRFTVEKLIVHKRFNAYTYDNDIALLKIKSSNGGCAVKSPSVRAVCLPPLGTQLPAGFQCSVAGYGTESSGAKHYAQLLKQGEVNLISNDDCKPNQDYAERINKNMICAHSPDWSTDACQGDSGGPLVCEVSGRRFQFGVVSWGEGCAERNNPGVYTQVSRYNKWITATTGLYKYAEGIMYPHK